MGKSPGKWIKAVLFGKKSKSGYSKNGSAEKRTYMEAKSQPVVAVNPHLSADLPPQTTYIGGESIELERGSSVNLSSETALVPQEQVRVVDNEEPVIEEQAAIKAQAAFRGYLARRAFRALKGIIRLQALVRGHLVRRQAVATFNCMHAIVRFQSIVRGQKVRLSDTGYEVLQKCKSGESMGKRLDLAPIFTHPRSEKLSRNVFIVKLVASLPSAKPLSLQYDPIEPNSAWSWLQRWSKSRFWEPLPKPKKPFSSKTQKKQTNNTTVPKRVVHRVAAVNGDDVEKSEKSKRTHRKSLSHQTEPVQEHPQNELERVKRSLRKVTASAEEGSTSVKTEAEKLPKIAKKTSPVAEVSEQGFDPVVVVAELPVGELPPKQMTMEEPVETTPVEVPTVELLSDSVDKLVNAEATEDVSLKDDETVVNEELSSKENQKARRRRSLPGKQEYPENNIAQNNSPTLPSYMAATKSAKAKLRAQGSPKVAEEVGEVGFVRRHSLPANANGKLSSQSPRIQKPVIKENGKGGSRSADRSLLSSRDGNEKSLLPGWRR